MATVWIKNNTGATGTWVGQELADQEYYLIQPQELFSWQTDNQVELDVAGGSLVVSNDGAVTGDLSATEGLNFLLGLDLNPRDSDNAKMFRIKQAKKGATYEARFIQFETSVLNSLVNLQADGSDWGDCTLKFYKDDSGTMVEITTQGELDTDCICTVLDFEPPYDYELIGGQAFSKGTPSEDYLMHCVGVPDVPAVMGGSKPMISNANFKYWNRYKIDGRTSKSMIYDATYHTNKMRKIIHHPAGGKLEFQILFEHYV